MVGWIKKMYGSKENGWTDKTNRWMVGRKTKLLKNRQIPKWKIGWIEKYGWLDGQKKKCTNRWMVKWIYIFFKDRLLVGWTGKKQKDGWIDIKMDGWMGNKNNRWMDEKKQMDGWMDKK